MVAVRATEETFHGLTQLQWTAWGVIATVAAVFLALVVAVGGWVARIVEGIRSRRASERAQAEHVSVWGAMGRVSPEQIGPVLYVHNGSAQPIHAVVHPFVFFDDGSPPPGVERVDSSHIGMIEPGATRDTPLAPESANRTPKPLRVAFTHARGVR